jgi:hypothetical protein
MAKIRRWVAVQRDGAPGPAAGRAARACEREATVRLRPKPDFRFSFISFPGEGVYSRDMGRGNSREGGGGANHVPVFSTRAARRTGRGAPWLEALRASFWGHVAQELKDGTHVAFGRRHPVPATIPSEHVAHTPGGLPGHTAHAYWTHRACRPDTAWSLWSRGPRGSCGPLAAPRAARQRPCGAPRGC